MPQDSAKLVWLYQQWQILVPAELFPQSDEAKHLDKPYEQRWDLLKPVISQLYMGKHVSGGVSLTIPQLSQFMKDVYRFHAA